MRTELFIAGRYLKPRRNAISFITLLSILGVTLGVAVLIVVLSVMTGFTDLMKEKLLDTQAHFQIRAQWGNGIYAPDEVIKAVEAAGGEAAAVTQNPVLVQKDKMLDTQVMFFGATEDSLRKRVIHDGVLKEGKLSIDKGEVVISRLMASRWGVRVGDKILLHTPQRLTNLVDFRPGGGVELNKNASAYLPAEFKITGIYEIGKYDFDNAVLFIGIDDAAELVGLPWGTARSIFCWGPDAFKQDRLVAKVQDAVPHLRVISWQEQSQQILRVLATEKNVMFFLLIFIVLVAAFSIMNTLITTVYQKTREIGVLKALGASDGAVTLIFLCQGLLIGVVGSISGTVVGSTVIYFRNDILEFGSKVFQRDLFPKEFYFFNGLPAHIVPLDVALIVGASILLCTVGALLPALCAAYLDPAKALRYE